MTTRGRKHHTKVVWPGFSNNPAPRHTQKIGRNEPCPCGSGTKYKDCHQADGASFLNKLERQAERQRRREVRQKLKEQGVPWYRRLFLQR